MTHSEVLELAAEANARWPHAQLPEASIALWARDLADLSFEAARTALAAFDRRGERFPPTAGLLRRELVALDQDVPDWDEAWAEILRAVRRVGSYGFPAEESWSSPLIRVFVADVGWRRICHENHDTTFEAQCREKWRSLAARAERDGALGGLPAAGLRRLERVASGPRPIAAALDRALPPSPDTTSDQPRSPA